jgi:ribonuclease VapC
VIVDTSALVAILTEPDGPAYMAAAAGAPALGMSAVTFYEARVVLGSRRDGRGRYASELVDDLDDLVATLRVEVVAFDRRQARLAQEAYQRFGKGHHRARLNLADCAAYALARHRGEPLLFKGEDFALTDVDRAL